MRGWSAEMKTYDIVDDLHVPREKVLHERDRPFLQRFWQHGVVREEERVRDDVPGRLPWDVFLVNEDTHELWDGKRRVGLADRQQRTQGNSPLIAKRTSLS